MEKLRTHVTHHKDSRIVADLYGNDNGQYELHINFEDNEVHVAHVHVTDKALEIWQEVVS